MEAALVEKSNTIMELTNENNDLKSIIKQLEVELEKERLKNNSMRKYESKHRSFDNELDRLERLNKNLEDENNELKTRFQKQADEIGRVEFLNRSMEEQVDGVKELNKILCTLMDESKSRAKQMENKFIAVQSENDNLVIKEQKLSILAKDARDRLFMLSDEIKSFTRPHFKLFRRSARDENDRNNILKSMNELAKVFWNLRTQSMPRTDGICKYNLSTKIT